MFTADQGVCQVHVTDLLVPGAPYFEPRVIHPDLQSVTVVLSIMLASVTSCPPSALHFLLEYHEATSALF